MINRGREGVDELLNPKRKKDLKWMHSHLKVINKETTELAPVFKKIAGRSFSSLSKSDVDQLLGFYGFE
jgi:hypothetical protein